MEYFIVIVHIDMRYWVENKGRMLILPAFLLSSYKSVKSIPLSVSISSEEASVK